MKRAVSFLLVLAFALGVLCGCDTGKPKKTLDTPKNLAISSSGVITWDAVENASSYVVTVGDKTYTVNETSYTVANTNVDFNYSVAARADGYNDSAAVSGTWQAPRKPDVPKNNIAVAVSGGTEIRPGKSMTLKATVTGTEDQTVIWSITRGAENATIDELSGRLTANQTVTGSGIVEVRATSLADETCYGTKVLTVLTKPTLTQDMLDKLAGQGKIGFDGFLYIEVYTIGLYSSLYTTSSTTVKTALDGTHWYAEYQNGGLGVTSALYYTNRGGVASQVGISFENTEEYAPMLDADGNAVSWEASGLYNNFAGLTTADFTFNEDTWRYEYTGADKTLPARMVASANPYDFVPSGLSLIIEEGEIMGLYSVCDNDYTVVPGYCSRQELTVAVNYGETVEVPTITRYATDDKGIHDLLNAAIAKMRALDSYTLTFKETTASYLTGGRYTTTGFIETITQSDCYFEPVSVRYNAQGVEEITKNGSPYGYHKIRDDLYNTYHTRTVGEGNLASEKFMASRAYNADFSHARPTFAFAAEIFNAYYADEDAGTVTYYVDEPMSGVASCFYYGVGNDIALYGIFAQKGSVTTYENGSYVTRTYTPFVTVDKESGYITEAGFYFYLGSIYGTVAISYSDFDAAALPEEVSFEGYTPREVPTSWNDLTVIISGQTDSTKDDHEEGAVKALREFFADEDICDKIPFFGKVLGDTYGFGMTTYHTSPADKRNHKAIVFYYDVPLDRNYTIDSSMTAVREYLVAQGFERNSADEYEKDGIVIAPIDSSLDFNIYVWKK